MLRPFYIFILFLLVGCKWEIPEIKSLKGCSKPTSVSFVVDPTNPRKYSFTLNDGEIKYPITWQFAGNNIGTSTTNTFSYTFSADGNFSVTALYSTDCGSGFFLNSSNFTVSILPTAEKSFPLTDPIVSVNPNVAVTNDGTVITSDGDVIKVWNYSTQTLIRSFAHSNSISYNSQRMVLSSDEKYIYSTNGQSINQWDWKTGVSNKTIYYSSLSGWLGNLNISGDGNFLIFLDAINVNANQWKIIIYDLLKNNYKEFTFNERPQNLKLNDDGSQFSYSLNNSHIHKVINLIKNVEIWSNTTIGQKMVISPNGKIGIYSSGSQNNLVTFNVWDIELNKILYDIKISVSNLSTFNLNSAIFSLDSKYVLLNGASFFDLENNRVLWTNNLYSPQLDYTGKFSQNSKYFILANNGTIELVDVAKGQKLSSILIRNNNLINKATISSDGKHTYTCDNSSLKIWDINTGTQTQTLTNFNKIYGYYRNNLSLGKNYIYLLQDNDIWKINKTSFEAKQLTFSKLNFNLIVARDDKYYGCNINSNNFTVFDGINNQQIFNIPEFINLEATFTSDNKYLISTYEDIRNEQYSLKIYNTSNGSLFKKINNITTQAPNAISASNITSNLVAYSSVTQLIIKNIFEDKIINSFNTPSFILNSVFSPDDKKIAGSSNNNKLYVYDLENNLLLKERTFPHPILSIAYNTIGTQIFVTTVKEFHIINAP